MSDVTGDDTIGDSGVVGDVTVGSDVREAAHEARLLQAGRMMAGIVHEIRNPLAVIHGYAQLLQERSVDEDDRRDLANILSETQRLSALVDDMLSFVRRGSDTVETVEVGRVVQAALNLMTHAMRQSRVAVVAHLPDAECRVRGQQGAYMQVLLNLLENARESLEQAGPTDRGVVLSVEPDRTPGHCTILVSNNGPPIPPEHAETIFDSFFTTKGSGDGLGGNGLGAGTGLGLALCREILGRFGGSIVLEATPGGTPGVTFRLDLPNA